jgi:beta-N-acetylhexosaminidase
LPLTFLPSDRCRLRANRRCAGCGADKVIGDRAYAGAPDAVAAIARAFADGLLSGGVLPVLKHLPGHGRATADSHRELPRVDVELEALRARDFAVFRNLSDLPLGMTAHVVYGAIDPIAPATTSGTVVHEVIRGWIGFRGLLMSDDISMGALSGPIAERSRGSIAAGCDLVLHCNVNLARCRRWRTQSRCLRRSCGAGEAALALRGREKPADTVALRAELQNLLGRSSGLQRASL